MRSDGSISACVIVPLKALWAFTPIGLETQDRLSGISLLLMSYIKKGQRSSVITSELLAVCSFNQNSVLLGKILFDHFKWISDWSVFYNELTRQFVWWKRNLNSESMFVFVCVIRKIVKIFSLDIENLLWLSNQGKKKKTPYTLESLCNSANSPLKHISQLKLWDKAWAMLSDYTILSGITRVQFVNKTEWGRNENKLTNQD